MARNNTHKPADLRKALLLLLVILLAAAAFAMLWYWVQQEGSVHPDLREEHIQYQGENYTAKKQLETLLVAGVEEGQAELLALMVLDHESQTWQLLHLRRDTLAEVSVLGIAGETTERVKAPIATAYTYGSSARVRLRNTANAVSELLQGAPVSHRLALSMEGLQILNDAVGGVTTEDQETPLSGTQAVAYIRFRPEAPAESAVRQSRYLEGLLQSLLKTAGQNPAGLLKTAASAAEYLTFDGDSSRLVALLQKAAGYTFEGIQTLRGEENPGQGFTPNETVLTETVIRLFYQQADRK